MEGLLWIGGASLALALVLALVFAVMRRQHAAMLAKAVLRVAVPSGAPTTAAVALPASGVVDLWLQLGFVCDSAFRCGLVTSVRVDVDGRVQHDAEFVLGDEEDSPIRGPNNSVTAIDSSVGPVDRGRERVRSTKNICPVSGPPGGTMTVRIAIQPKEPATEIESLVLYAVPR